MISARSGLRDYVGHLQSRPLTVVKPEDDMNMINKSNVLDDEQCTECGKLPVKTRPNTTCQTCDATVCKKCQTHHFMDKHES
jgi:hypothetical protein